MKMVWLATVVLMFGIEIFQISCASTESPMKYPVGDIRNCPLVSPITGKPLYRMEVLPGLGFDNLRNYDMNQVVQYNYSLCKTTNDGRFLIPDDMITVPIQRSWIETFSEIYNHWDDYVSTTSFSLNVEGSFTSKIEGKFSVDYQHIKQYQVTNKAKTTLSHVRNTLYNVMLEADAPLHPKFKNRLLDIAANIQDNNTEYAAYLSELLVRDYGSHIVRKVEAGGLISQIDSVSSSYMEEHKNTIVDVSGAASASFLCAVILDIFPIFCHVDGSFGFNYKRYDTEGYSTNRFQSIIQTIGGPQYAGNMTFKQWQAGLLDLLAATDRAGDPLHYVVTSASIPELPNPLLNQLADSVYTAVNKYYTVNTIYGCTDPEASNFDYYANLDDGSCGRYPPTNFSFGGVYQTCEVDENNNYEDLCAKGAATINPLTNDYSCPSGYTAVELHSGTVTHATKREYCDEHCTSSVMFSKCYCLSAWENVISVAYYKAYWCVAEGNQPGYMFGGTYTSSTINPNTGSSSCPAHFIPLLIGQDLKVCVSNDGEALAYSRPFGGFFSCEAANPLSTTKGKSLGASQCPVAYRQVLAAVYDGCEIHYCTQVKNKNYGRPPTPKLPPFRSKPGPKASISQSMVIEGAYGELWLRDAKGSWYKHVDQPVITGEDVLKHFTEEDNKYSNDTGSPSPSTSGGMSATVSAVISSAVTLVVCAVIVLAIFGIYKIIKRKKGRSGSTYTSIEDEVNASSTPAGSTSAN